MSKETESKKRKADQKAAEKERKKREKELIKGLGKVGKELEEQKAKGEALEAKKKAWTRILEGRKEGGDEALTQMSSTKQARFMFNPFNVEKSKYTRPIFEACNPFVEVIVTPGTELKPPGFPDKVCDGRHMDKDALEAAIKVLVEPVIEGRLQFKGPQTELGGRHLHGMILRQLKRLTRPLRSEQERPSDAFQEDVVVKLGGAVTMLSGYSSNDDVEQADDGRPGDTELLTKKKYDIKGLVYDTRLETDKQLVTVLLVECEWEQLSMDKMYQGAGYAVKDAIRNFSQGRTDPLYIQSWSEEKWRYAVAYPQRLVEVAGNHVTRVTPECSSDELSALESALQAKTKDLAQNFLFPERYPDGTYLQGVLHVIEQEFQLPCTIGVGLSREQYMFYESLLRIFVGDRVLSWTKEDVKDIVSAREAELARLVNAALLSGSSSYEGLLKLQPAPVRYFQPKTRPARKKKAQERAEDGDDGTVVVLGAGREKLLEVNFSGRCYVRDLLEELRGIQLNGKVSLTPNGLPMLRAARLSTGAGKGIYYYIEDPAPRVVETAANS